MPRYRLIFEYPEGTDGVPKHLENANTANIETGDEVYQFGRVLEHGGTSWQVSKAPREDPGVGETADLLVWPA